MSLLKKQMAVLGFLVSAIAVDNTMAMEDEKPEQKIYQFNNKEESESRFISNNNSAFNTPITNKTFGNINITEEDMRIIGDKKTLERFLENFLLKNINKKSIECMKYYEEVLSNFQKYHQGELNRVTQEFQEKLNLANKSKGKEKNKDKKSKEDKKDKKSKKHKKDKKNKKNKK